VWDILERRVRVGFDPYNFPKRFCDLHEQKEYYREHLELKQLDEKLSKKGTPRDKLILDLFDTITLQLGSGETDFRYLSRQEFRQLRLQVELMSEAEIAGAIQEQMKCHKQWGEESGALDQLRWSEARRTAFVGSPLIPSARKAEVSLLGVRGHSITEQWAREEKKEALRNQQLHKEAVIIESMQREGLITNQEAEELYTLNRKLSSLALTTEKLSRT
jgi:hypothetical protein